MAGSFSKKKKKMAGYWKYMYVDLYMLKIWLLTWCKGSIENVTVGVVVEFEKKKKMIVETK